MQLRAVYAFLGTVTALYLCIILSWDKLFPHHEHSTFSTHDSGLEMRVGGLSERFMVSKLRRENKTAQLDLLRDKLDNSRDKEAELQERLQKELEAAEKLQESMDALHKRNKVLREELQEKIPPAHDVVTRAPTLSPTPAPTPSPFANEFPKILPNTVDDAENKRRRQAVRDAFNHSWTAYHKYAMGHDELQPISQIGRDWLGPNMGATVFDTIDTAFILGFREAFDTCRDWVKNHFFIRNTYSDIPFFEATIRMLGGCVSAFELTGDEVFREKAESIGEVLIHAFSTPTGFPSPRVNAQVQAAFYGGSSYLAEIGSAQLEFNSLSYMTHNATYFDKPMKVFEQLRSLGSHNGLFPSTVEIGFLGWGPSEYSFAGLSDSFYEYLLKVHLQTGDPELRKMYDEAVDGAVQLIVKQSKSGLTFLTDSITQSKMEHLACFAGGMFALGAATMDPGREDYAWRYKRDMELAANVTRACHEMYERSPTGLAPESTLWGPNIEASSNTDFIVANAVNIQRPETMESLFYMWRVTHDQKYRDWGWKIMEAFEKHTKVQTGGYSGLTSVEGNNPTKDDVQQSFWIAETLKYAYLLFSNDDVLPLNEWVFNTEAHPVRVHAGVKVRL